MTDDLKPREGADRHGMFHRTCDACGCYWGSCDEARMLVCPSCDLKPTTAETFGDWCSRVGVTPEALAVPALHNAANGVFLELGGRGLDIITEWVKVKPAQNGVMDVSSLVGPPNTKADHEPRSQLLDSPRGRMEQIHDLLEERYITHQDAMDLLNAPDKADPPAEPAPTQGLGMMGQAREGYGSGGNLSGMQQSAVGLGGDNLYWLATKEAAEHAADLADLPDMNPARDYRKRIAGYLDGCRERDAAYKPTVVLLGPGDQLICKTCGIDNGDESVLCNDMCDACFKRDRALAAMERRARYKPRELDLTQLSDLNLYGHAVNHSPFSSERLGVKMLWERAQDLTREPGQSFDDWAKRLGFATDVDYRLTACFRELHRRIHEGS